MPPKTADTPTGAAGSTQGPRVRASVLAERVPAWARWPLLYLALLASGGALGALTPMGAGNAIFLAGAAALLVSIAFVRLGGERKRVGRDQEGRPIWAVDPQARRAEIRRGVGVFLVAMALWGTVLVAALLRGDLP